MLALVPLMAGGDPDAAGNAIEEIRNVLPGAELARLLRRMNMDALQQIITQSPTWKKLEAENMARLRTRLRAEILEQGQAEGLAQGRLEGQRSACLTLVRKHHPDLLEQVTPRVQSCADTAWLEACILAAADQDEAGLVRLLEDPA